MRRLSIPLLALCLATACGDAAPDGIAEVAESTAALVSSPLLGGPWGSATTCSTSVYYPVAANGAVPAQVTTYLDNAAANWGCSYSKSWHAPHSTGANGLGAYKWYRTSSGTDVGYGTYNDCGVAYWNNATQCAYFLPARNTTCTGGFCLQSSRTGTSVSNVLLRYKQLGYEAGLGLPISNPVPASWTSTYYQLFDKGVITHHASHGTRYVGGSNATDQALASAYRERFAAHPTSPGSPPVYPLTQDAGCTASIVGSTSCASSLRTGRYTRFFDFYQNAGTFLISRDGWSRAFLVDGPDATAWAEDAGDRTGYSWTPWSGGVGFPLEDIRPAGTTASGQPIYNQQFEWGNIIRQPDDCAAGATESTVIYQNAGPLTNASSYVGFCPGSSIGPTCIQDDQPYVPFVPPGGGTGRYRGLCGLGFDEWPVAVELQWGGPNQPLGAPVAVYEPVLRDWKEGLPIEQAIAKDGLPTSGETCSSWSGWCTTEFDKSAIYRTVGAPDTLKVSGAFFTKFHALGGPSSCMGLPTADSPTSGPYPRTQTFVGGTISEVSAGVTTSNCLTQLFDTYCWFPEVRGSKTDSVHESLNSEAFFYWNISPEGDTKSGRPPAFLGLSTIPGQQQTYDTNVYGNNFQGPVLVNGDRGQWEFSSSSSAGYFSTRIYPLIYGQKCITVPQLPDGTSTPPDGGWKNSKIREDDECWGCDDTVGYVRWDYYDLCNPVWATSDTGWSAIQRSLPEDNKVSGSFEFFDYRHYCYRCRNQGTSHEECTKGVDTNWTLYGGDL